MTMVLGCLYCVFHFVIWFFHRGFLSVLPTSLCGYKKTPTPLGELCKGSTTPFDGVRIGSNPVSPAKTPSVHYGVGFTVNPLTSKNRDLWKGGRMVNTTLC